MTTLFSDGFESGDFSAWGWTDGAPSVVSTDKHHGTYSMYVDAANEWAAKDAGSHSDLFVRGYYKLPTLPSDGNGIQLMYCYDTAWTNRIICGISNSGGTYYLDVYTTQDGWTKVAISISANTWFCIEMERKAGAGTGVKKGWFNGELKVNRTGLTETNNSEIVYVGGNQAAYTVYIDCIVVADAYIGPEVTTYTKTFTLDGQLQKAATKTLTFDGQLIKSLTKTLTLDGLLQKSFTGTFTFDGLMQKTSTSTFTLDGQLQKILTKTLTFDGQLQKAATGTFTFDGQFRKSLTKTLTFDGLLQKTQTVTFTLDGLLQKALTAAFTFDGQLTQTGSATFTFDAQTQKAFTKAFTFDASLQAYVQPVVTQPFEQGEAHGKRRVLTPELLWLIREWLRVEKT